MKTRTLLLLACIVAACGGQDIETSEQVGSATASAGHNSPASRSLRWTGTQFCSGSIGAAALKSSDETELGGFEKTSTRVKMSGLSVGPSEEYSCSSLAIDGLVTMSDNSGAFFEGNDPVECRSMNGRSLTATLGLGHDTDLRFLSPTETPTLSFDVALTSAVTKGQRDLLGDNAQPEARFTCSFDLELR